MSRLVHYFVCDAGGLAAHVHALRGQQEALTDETERLFEEAVAAAVKETVVGGVREEELEALVRCCAPGAAGGDVAEIIEEVGEDGLRVLVISDAAVRALAGMAVGPDLPGRWAKAAGRTRRRGRATDEQLLTEEAASDLRDLARAAAAGEGLRLYFCVYP